VLSLDVLTATTTTSDRKSIIYKTRNSIFNQALLNTAQKDIFQVQSSIWHLKKSKTLDHSQIPAPNSKRTTTTNYQIKGCRLFSNSVAPHVAEK